MGYVMFSARKQYLTSKINTINAQLTMLSEAQSAMQINQSNATRQRSAASMWDKLMNTYSVVSSAYNAYNKNNNNILGSMLSNMLGGSYGNGYGNNILSNMFGGGYGNNMLGSLMGGMLGNMFGGGNGLGSMLSGVLGCGGAYNAMPLTNDWLQYAPEFMQNSLIENDIDQQKTALETQLKVATKELESVEKAEDAAIQRSTPKYA